MSWFPSPDKLLKHAAYTAIRRAVWQMPPWMFVLFLVLIIIASLAGI